MDSIVEIEGVTTAPPWGELGRAFTLGVVSGVSKLVLTVLNSTKIHGHETFLDSVMQRPENVGLITIANHTSMFDDPGLLSVMLPWSFFWTEPRHHGVRWTMCAREVCFKNELLRQFFLNGKTLPIVRGAGVMQPVLSFAAEAVSHGEWMHVFPEGRIMFTGKLGPFRWGVGKVVCESRKANGGRDPIVLPFYHSGMGDVLPVKAVLPRVGQEVTVTVGEPLDLSDITCRCNKPGEDQQQVWKDITLRMHEALRALEARSPPNTYQGENPPGRPGQPLEERSTDDPRLAPT